MSMVFKRRLSLALALLLAWLYLGPVRWRPNRGPVLLGVALVVAGVVPTILQPARMGPLEWLLLIAGAAILALGLEALTDHPVRILSAGQRRRVALARLVLAAARPLWVLDEPTVALDVEGVATLGRVLAAHRARGGVVVASSHLALPLNDAAELRLAA